MIRLGSVLVCWTLWLSAASIVHAQTSVVIVVPQSSTDDYTAYEHRLRSELISEGFQPVSVEIPTEVSAPMLKQNAVRLSSPAVISLSIRDGVISGLVWIQSRGKGNDLLRSVPEYPLSEQAPTVFAVKAADALHGGLLELGYIGTSPEVPPAPTSGAPTLAPPPPIASASATSSASVARPQPKLAAPPPAPRGQTPPKAKRDDVTETWRIRGMFSLVEHFLRSPFSLGTTVSATHRIHTNWRAGLAGTYLTAVRGRTEPDMGQASVTQAFIGPRLELWQTPTKRVTTFEFLEAGAHAIYVVGRANPPNVPLSTHSYTAHANLGFGAALAISDTLGFTAQSGLLLPWKRSDVIVARTPVVEAAGPALLFNAGLELSL